MESAWDPQEAPSHRMVHESMVQRSGRMSVRERTYQYDALCWILSRSTSSSFFRCPDPCPLSESTGVAAPLSPPLGVVSTSIPTPSLNATFALFRTLLRCFQLAWSRPFGRTRLPAFEGPGDGHGATEERAGEAMSVVGVNGRGEFPARGRLNGGVPANETGCGVIGSGDACGMGV
jgi:hypothetical protein